MIETTTEIAPTILAILSLAFLNKRSRTICYMMILMAFACETMAAQLNLFGIITTSTILFIVVASSIAKRAQVIRNSSGTKLFSPCQRY